MSEFAAFDRSPLPIPPPPRPEAFIGAASPLWGYFMGAAATGVAWWWMTRWAHPENLEALFEAAAPRAAKTEAAPLMPVGRSMVTAMASEPPAAPVGGEAAPVSPLADAAAAAEPALREGALAAEDVAGSGLSMAADATRRAASEAADTAKGALDAGASLAEGAAQAAGQATDAATDTAKRAAEAGADTAQKAGDAAADTAAEISAAAPAPKEPRSVSPRSRGTPPGSEPKPV